MSDLVKVIRQKMWWFQEGARYVVKEKNGMKVRVKGSGRGSRACPEAGETLFIQQDGAIPHRAKANGRVFKRYRNQAGFIWTSSPSHPAPLTSTSTISYSLFL